jgi:hypothetical protein
VVDESGLYGGRFVATKEGFAVEELAVTDEGVVQGLTVGVVEEEEEEENKE